MSLRIATAAVSLALVTGCAGRGHMYHWGRYDESLYRHYKNPQDRAAWVEALFVTIREAEERGLRVPPGVHAEYGHALYEEGRFAEAVAAFQREREEWPESQVLMDKMIRMVELRSGTPAARLVPAAQGASAAGGGAR